MIRIFPENAENFESMGFGSLTDAVSCSVREELNGAFELEMEYPINGLNYSEIQEGRIICVKSNPYSSNPQAFRIYSITKPIGGVVTINAEHISYDLSGYPVSDFFTMTNLPDALSSIMVHTIEDCPFSVHTARTDSGEFSVEKPVSIRAALGSDAGSILDIFGGEYEFDNFDVTLHSTRGENRGVRISYGKNLTDLTQEENCSNVCSGIYPFWYSEEEGLYELPEKYIIFDGQHDHVRILPVDLSSEFDSAPLESALRESAEQYVVDHNLEIPVVSLTISFVDLNKSPEFYSSLLMNRIYLGDTVSVDFEKLGVSATARCIVTVYNVITDQYSEIELGSPQKNISDTIIETQKTIENVPTESFIDKAINEATRLITGGLGGYVVLRNSTGGIKPDELLIMNTDSILTATKVWRFNQNGLGYSSTGYNGPYSLALTSNGEIVADRILTGELDGARIKAGTITTNHLSFNLNDTITGVINPVINGLELISTVEGPVGEVFNPYSPNAYSFVKDSNGYYNSTNQGINNSFSYAVVEFNFAVETEIIISCMSYGERNYDFGLISELDKFLARDNSEDSSNVFYSFKGRPVNNYIELTMTIPAGVHGITIKYKKDSSVNESPDKMSFKCMVGHGNSSKIGLYNGTTLISSANIVIQGMVTFEDLATAGTTTINGSNITTGLITADVIDTSTLKVQTVFYKKDNANYYSILSANIVANNTYTYVGPRDIIDSDFAQFLVLYGTQILCASDSSTELRNQFVIDNNARCIRPFSDARWNVGSVQYSFDKGYFTRLYLWDSEPDIGDPLFGYLRIRNSRLQWVDADGNSTYLT